MTGRVFERPFGDAAQVAAAQADPSTEIAGAWW